MSAFSAGIDLGTTFAAAAIYRNGTTEPIQLEADRMESPSAVAIDADGRWLIGQEALASGLPTARHFKRRLGSDQPLRLAGGSYSAQSLTAQQLRWVLTRIRTAMGADPAAIVLTHPSDWGGARVRQLENAAQEVGMDSVAFLREPIAAASFFAARNSVPDGNILAIYDMGGGTTDVAVLEKKPGEFEHLASSGADIGGIDFDFYVMEMIEEKLGIESSQSLERLATEAKEALSTSASYSRDVEHEGSVATISLEASEVWRRLTPQAEQAAELLSQVLKQAKLEPSHVAAVLLAGGSSSAPFVKSAVARVAGRDPVVPEYPKYAVAFGAAIAAAATANIQVTTEAPSPPVANPVTQAPSTTETLADDSRAVPVVPVNTSGLHIGPRPVLLDDNYVRKPVLPIDIWVTEPEPAPVPPTNNLLTGLLALALVAVTVTLIVVLVTR